MSFASVFVASWCALVLCTNVADSVPIFPSTTVKSVNVAESAALNHRVTNKVKATGTGTLRYGLHGETPKPLLFNTFSVDARTGDVRVVWPLDYEDVDSFLLLISATDTSGTAYHKLTVKVTDVDEPPEFYGFLFVKTEFSIAEEAKIGTSVTTISANDPEGETVAYTIEPSTSDFKIGGNSGVIRSTALMNQTVTPSYSLTVWAKAGRLSKSLPITISVNRALFLDGGYVSLLVLLALFIIH